MSEERTRQIGARGDAPSHAGIGQTFAGQRLVTDPAALAGVDVAVVGAPFDDGTSNRPGARFGPRAIRAADDGGHAGRPHLRTGIDPFAVLDVVDHGDCAVAPGDLPRSHEHLAAVLRGVLAAGAVPLVLGGDHSLSLPTLRVLGETYGADGYAVVHFDTHADTAAELYGVRVSHGTPFRVAVEEGHLRGEHIVQIGLRGTWPGPDDLAWMRQAGFAWHTMEDIDAQGLDAVLDASIAHVAERAERVYLTVDVDVLDPAFAPGTGTPEPGGMTTRELHRALHRVAGALDVCAVDVVEVCPPFDVAGITALAAERIAIDVLTGMAARRGGTPLG
jgi:agmatinase